jgi:hypothetical protein
MANSQQAETIVRIFRDQWTGSSPDKTAVQRFFDAERPSADTIALGMFLASRELGGRYWDHIRATLDAYLQKQLTEEHIAAQEKLSRAAEQLQTAALSVARASYWMTFAAFVVTTAALVVAVLK